MIIAAVPVATLAAVVAGVEVVVKLVMVMSGGELRKVVKVTATGLDVIAPEAAPADATVS